MTEPTRAALRRRERELAAELASRRTTNEIQADSIRGGPSRVERSETSGLTTSQLQARVALGAVEEEGDEGYDPDELPKRAAMPNPRLKWPSGGYS